jgi:hypothetical protein
MIRVGRKGYRDGCMLCTVPWADSERSLILFLYLSFLVSFLSWPRLLFMEDDAGGQSRHWILSGSLNGLEEGQIRGRGL